MANILIIGAGEIGNAIHNALDDSHKIALWDKDSNRGQSGVILEDEVRNSNIIFLSIPTFALREVMTATTPSLVQVEKKPFLISISKGLERDTNKFGFEIMEEFVTPEGYAIFGGPVLAEELSTGQGAVGILASINKDIFNSVSPLFKADFIALHYSNKVSSIALASVLKNIYSIALGIAEGLPLSSNLQGAIFSQSIEESIQIARYLNVDEEPILGIAGLGDFIATSFSSYSANRQNGLALAKGETPGFSEGLVALPTLRNLLGGNISNLPLLQALYSITEEKANPKDTLVNLIYGR